MPRISENVPDLDDFASELQTFKGDDPALFKRHQGKERAGVSPVPVIKSWPNALEVDCSTSHENMCTQILSRF